MSIGTTRIPYGPGSRRWRAPLQGLVRPSTNWSSVNLSIQPRQRVRLPRNAFLMHSTFASSSTTGGAIWNPKLEMLQLAKQPASRSVHMRTSISLLCRSWPAMSRSIVQKHKRLRLSPRPATHRPLRSFLRASSFSRKNYWRRTRLVNSGCGYRHSGGSMRPATSNLNP